jgi:hypothetical protein
MIGLNQSKDLTRLRCVTPGSSGMQGNPDFTVWENAGKPTESHKLVNPLLAVLQMFPT